MILVEDQTMILDLFVDYLYQDPSFKTIYKATDMESAVSIMQSKPYINLIVSDIMLGGSIEKNGLALLKWVRNSNSIPNSPKFILITAALKVDQLDEAIGNDVNGFLLKDEPLKYFKKAILGVMSGEVVISGEILKTSWLHRSILTDKERLILSYVLEGNSNQKIASKICVTEGTVKNYISIILKKIKCSNRYQAAVKAQENGWI